jgi:hypothetical protein
MLGRLDRMVLLVKLVQRVPEAQVAPWDQQEIQANKVTRVTLEIMALRVQRVKLDLLAIKGLRGLRVKQVTKERQVPKALQVLLVKMESNDVR